jgi:restriction system protein
MAKKTAQGPKFVSYFWPVVDVLKTLGGSARPSEVREQLVKTLGISEEAQEDTLPSGFPRFDNQVAWARFYLAKAGIIDSSARGVWTLTEKGRAMNRMTHQEAIELFRGVHKQFHTDRESERVEGVEEGDTIPPQDVELSTTKNYRQQLLDILRSLPPSGFERFC